jgi:RNA polymerase-binding transcription factor DksA
MGAPMHYRYLTLEQRANLEHVLSPGKPEDLARLHTPDYGVCESCGCDIPYVRLMEYPRATRCAVCEAKR